MTCLSALIGGSAVACSSPGSGLAIARSAAHAKPSAARTWTKKPPTPSPSPAAPTIPVPSAPRGVRAKEAALVDAATGQVLWSRAMNAERPIGSVAKVMTALLVISAGNLDQQIRIPREVLSYVWKYGATSASLHPGDVLTARQLLEALMLPSGADAAYALAITYGPGMNAFIARMNATAARMGMAHTHFTSPDGLPYPTEYSTYSTPADLITLGLAAMKSPVFRSVVDQTFYQLRKGPWHHAYWWDQTNELVGHYAGAIGIKTGYTNDANHCLLFEAVRNGRALIGVVLDSPATGPGSAAIDAIRMLNWGFSLHQAH
ncbi:MAG: D-alanyl-D-alanine carboxypeptidase [Streptosporangiaceae bacterium]|nr:D-alanyl-D-alanine carboxypeptidase [Streptosporangiaceae bacterium]MBV9857489.1 D-alanyl-D-alanine carboxypeptidase [Streptosporangiaceae bacterium]